MATYDHLPVYKVCFDLLVLLYQMGGNMQRDYRFTLGELMKKELIALLLNVYKANSSVARRKDFLGDARENLETVRLLLRITMELKQVSLKVFVASNEKIEVDCIGTKRNEQGCRGMKPRNTY
jgi:hypothetical protein